MKVHGRCHCGAIELDADVEPSRVTIFCDMCGTPIFTRAVEPSPTFGLRIGCLDKRTELRPAQRIWCRSALGWSQNIEVLPQQPTQ